MGIKGRKPKPSSLRLVEGNRGKRPLNKNEAKPEIKRIDPPGFLHEYAKEEWRRVSDLLYNLGLMSEIDRGALAICCQAYARWRQAEEALAEQAKEDLVNHSLTIQTINKNNISNPLVGIANKAMADYGKYCTEFGMTPSARSRIDTEIAGRAQAQDPAEQYFD